MKHKQINKFTEKRSLLFGKKVLMEKALLPVNCYLTVFDERNTVYFLESFGGLFWKFLAVSRRSTD